MGVLSRFKKELETAQKSYKEIGSVRCPYFDKNITFNSDGFHHLRYNSPGSERTKKSQMNKLNLLPGAVEIISKSGTVQQYRKQWGIAGRKRSKNGAQPMKEMQYWAFEGIIGTGNKMRRIKAVVRQVGAG